MVLLTIKSPQKFAEERRRVMGQARTRCNIFSLDHLLAEKYSEKLPYLPPEEWNMGMKFSVINKWRVQPSFGNWVPELVAREAVFLEEISTEGKLLGIYDHENNRFILPSSFKEEEFFLPLRRSFSKNKR